VEAPESDSASENSEDGEETPTPPVKRKARCVQTGSSGFVIPVRVAYSLGRSSKDQPASKRKREEAELDQQIDDLLEGPLSDDEEGEVDDVLGSEDDEEKE
jgi:hypothetical protein